MKQTVVGIFDNATEALNAVQKLVEQGITRESIDLSNNTNANYSADSNEHESGITKFFKNLFSDDDDNASKYAGVAVQSQSIVTVHAQSDEEATKAADILDDNGAVDVDERAAGYSNSTSDTNTTNSFGNTSNAIGAFDTGTAAGPSGTASLPDDFSHLENANGDVVNTNIDLNNEPTEISTIEDRSTSGNSDQQIISTRLRSRIIQRPVEESFRLREERGNEL